MQASNAFLHGKRRNAMRSFDTKFIEYALTANILHFIFTKHEGGEATHLQRVEKLVLVSCIFH